MQRFMDSESGLEGVDIRPTTAQGPGPGEEGDGGDVDGDDLEIDFDRVLRLIDGSNDRHVSNGNTEKKTTEEETGEKVNRKGEKDPLSNYFYAEDLQPLSPDDSDDEGEEGEGEEEDGGGKDRSSVPTMKSTQATQPVSPTAAQRQGLAQAQGPAQGSVPTSADFISPSHQGLRRFNLPSIEKEPRSEEKEKAIFDEVVAVDSDDETDDDDDATDGEGIDGEEGQEMNAAFFEEYQQHMDRELASSTLFETFERQKDGVGDATAGTGAHKAKVKSGDKGGTKAKKQADSDDEEEEDEETIAPVDDEFNLLKNLLESRASQLGAAGPATQLLSQLGIHLPPLPPMHQQQDR